MAQKKKYNRSDQLQGTALGAGAGGYAGYHAGKYAGAATVRSTPAGVERRARSLGNRLDIEFSHLSDVGRPYQGSYANTHGKGSAMWAKGSREGALKMGRELTPGVKAMKRGGAIGAGVGAVAGGAAVYRLHKKPKTGVRKNMSNYSYWGIDHGEDVSKALSDRPGFKAAVWNKDTYGSPDAKNNRKILRRARLKGQAKGAAVGAAAGVGAVAASRFRSGAKVASGFARGLGEGRGNAMRYGAGHGAFNVRQTRLSSVALGAAGGAVAGQQVGDYRGSKKAMRNPGYKAR